MPVTFWIDEFFYYILPIQESKHLESLSGIYTSGAFVSEAWVVYAYQTKYHRKSGLLDLLEPSDVTMADKDLTMANKEILLNIPSPQISICLQQM